MTEPGLIESRPAGSFPAEPKTIEPRAALAAGAVLVLILYGSLFPFRFDNPVGSWREALPTTHAYFTRIDFVSNILFYVPLGITLVLSFPRLKWPVGIGFAVVVGMLVSTSLETLQSYDDGRSSSLWDVLANGLGTLSGAGAGHFFRKKRTPMPRLKLQKRPYVVLLLACWLGYWLFPYVGAIKPGRFMSLFHQLASGRPLDPAQILQQFATWLTIGILMEALMGARKIRSMFAIAASGALLGRVMLVGAQLTPEQLLGGLAAIVAWSVFFWKYSQRNVVVAVLLTSAVAVDAMRPFTFTTGGRGFGLIPFASFLNAGLASATSSMFAKLFSYGALLWMLMRAGVAWGFAALGSAVFVLGLRMVQVLLPERSAEITDALLVLALAIIMKLMNEIPSVTADQPDRG
jgi:VanZ family protein/uncharacterized membrane protein